MVVLHVRVQEICASAEVAFEMLEHVVVDQLLAQGPSSLEAVGSVFLLATNMLRQCTGKATVKQGCC